MATIEIEGLTKTFPPRGGTGGQIRAVDNVSLTISPGESVALVGESGSGKSTIARMLVQLESPTAGEIRIDGKPIRQEPRFRSRVQMVLQDPFSSFNPAHTLGYSLRRPLEIQLGISKEEAINRVVDMLVKVGLVPAQEYLDKYANQMSGGQRQRANIARALLLEPEFIIADEPTSMLDVSVGMGILNLLLDLKELNVSYLFITHNLAAARYIAGRIAVLYRGEVVEVGESDAIIQHPMHPYTRVLVDATPDLEKPAIFEGTLDSGESSAGGCRFSARCPYRMEKCAEEIQLKAADERLVRCILY